MNTTVTSEDVRAALMLRYPAASHALMFEVAPRTGGGTRYADAVAVGLWASHGHKIEGFEIKVSRSDFLHEMRQPEKSAPVFQYCNRWWLVCPKGMVAPAELPSNWGMLELWENGTLRERVKAPALQPSPVTIGFFASLIRRSEPDNAVLDKLLQREAKAQFQRIEQQIKHERRRELSARQEAAEEAAKRIEALKERTGIDLAEYRYGDDWFRAVELLHALGKNWGAASLPLLVKSLQGCVRAIEQSGLMPEEPQAS